MCTHNIILKLFLASISDNMFLYITDVPDIPSFMNICTTSACNEIHPFTYENLHRTFLTQNEQNKNDSI